MKHSDDKGKPTKKIAAPAKQKPLPKTKQKFTDNSASSQCARLLEALKQGPITTFDAMRKLDCYHPPARIITLRKRGHNITTVKKQIQTEAGTWHWVGLYILTVAKE